MFAGIKSQTADLDALRQAIALRRSDVPDEEIWGKTRWCFAGDGKWRTEIPDHSAQMRVAASLLESLPIERLQARAIKAMVHANDQITVEITGSSPGQNIALHRISSTFLAKLVGDGALAKLLTQVKDSLGWAHLAGDFEIKRIQGMPLQDVLYHPGLFESYPNLRNVEVNLPSRGGHRPASGLTISRREISIPSLLVAIQGYVQDIEGFDKGIAIEHHPHLLAFLSESLATSEDDQMRLEERKVAIEDDILRCIPEDLLAEILDFCDVQAIEMGFDPSAGDKRALASFVSTYASKNPVVRGSLKPIEHLLESLDYVEQEFDTETFTAQGIYTRFVDSRRLGPVSLFEVSHGYQEALNTVTRQTMAPDTRWITHPKMTMTAGLPHLQFQPAGFREWLDDLARSRSTNTPVAG